MPIILSKNPQRNVGVSFSSNTRFHVSTTITGPTGAIGPSGTGAFTRVRVVSTTNVVIATALENGDTLNGVVLATNDLVLLAGQTNNTENGVYVVPASGAASRHSDFDTYDELPGTYFAVMEGTSKADTLWRCTSNKGGTLGATAITITQFVGMLATEIGALSSADLRGILTDETGTGAAVFATSPTLVTPVLGVATATSVAVDDLAYDPSTWNGSLLAPTRNAIRDRIESAGFAAHKGASSQAGIASATYTKVTFTTELFDIGSNYDAANSRWTPPAGRILICAHLYFSAGPTDGGLHACALYKNGALFKQGFNWTGSANVAGPQVNVIDDANGTDFYEIYAYGTSGGTLTVEGGLANSYFQGKMI